jgi:hypothetical protein
LERLLLNINDKKSHIIQGGLASDLKFATDSISASLLTTSINLSKPANLVGETSFSQVLSSCQAQISGNGGIHKSGLTAGDYLANPIMSRLPPPDSNARNLSSADHQADVEPEINSEISLIDPNDIRVGKHDVSTPPPQTAQPSEGDTIEQSIRKAAAKYNLPGALIKAVIKAESNFDATAVSSAGARGLMQLMPATAEELGVKNSFDIEQNIDGGSRYLRKMLDKFGGNTKLALAAYNSGPGTVQKYNGKVPYPETRDYVKRVMRFSAMFS